ncbi:MAG: Inosose isomerase [Candidatus Peribacteria bacterium GW2011_GWB1_54_5]|nr:MAG: Inosose isomerase [Candidatus Peribacteria bacterium GW2011_GWB1_54_5]
MKICPQNEEEVMSQTTTLRGPSLFIAQGWGKKGWSNLKECAQSAAALGYKGLQATLWTGGAIDTKLAAESKTYCDEQQGIATGEGCPIVELANHVEGQLMRCGTAYRPQFHANAFGKNLVCDNQSGTIYELSSTTYTDVGGSVLRRERRTPHLSDENRRLFFDYFELECERGVGLASATVQGYDPLVALRYSNDGGHTWGASRTRPIGRRGDLTLY